MGYVFYLSALLWGFMGGDIGSETVTGLLSFLIGAIFFVGGAVIFAINDLKEPRP